MPKDFYSIFLLTILLAIGLVFFLRAASKDRTTVIDVQSSLPPLEVLNGISTWLEDRGWHQDGGDLDRQVLRFQGNVQASKALGIFLSLLGGLGSGSLGLVLRQVSPELAWWPLLLIVVGGPLAGFVYSKRATRTEFLELRLMTPVDGPESVVRLRAHRDEIIAMESELGQSLKLASDGSLMSSPI